jgi:CspA family cold shock protein
MSKVKQGTVKWFNDSKGYGFLSPDDGGKDLFVHKNEIKMEGFKTLKERQEVDFDEGVSDKGPCATNVIPK